MSGDNRQVLELAKQGLTAEEIAESLGYDVESVVLMLNLDADVRKALAKDGNTKVLDLIDNKFQALLPSALAIAQDLMEDENVKPSVRSSLVQFVIKQQSGMLKPRQTNIQINVGDINDRLKQVKRRKEEIERGAILVESTAVTV